MSLFFELIQLSLGRRDCFSLCPSEKEWGELFELAKMQALVGVLFSGVERLPEEQRPPKDILLKWFAMTEMIEKENRRMNDIAVRVQERFMKEGFRSCILKGQGVATLYPNPLRRQSGDIDIWLEGKRGRIIEYVQGICRPKKILWYHLDFTAVKDAEVEVHFMPSWMFNLFTDRRLQAWFKDRSEEMFENTTTLPNGSLIHVPTQDFNIVYLLIHIYRHLFEEGIGLRQLMDYYFLLLSAKENRNYWLGSLVYGTSGVQESDFKFLSSLVLKFLSCLPYNLKTLKPHNLTYRSSDEECNCLDGRTDEHNGRRSNCSNENCERIKLLKSLKLYKFARAVMWVLGEVFGLEREMMYVEPDEKEGRFLLEEIMMAGNFGKYDPRRGDIKDESILQLFIRKQKRSVRFIRSYPSEVVWSPIFAIYQRLWRWGKGYLK